MRRGWGKIHHPASVKYKKLNAVSCCLDISRIYRRNVQGRRGKRVIKELVLARRSQSPSIARKRRRGWL